MQRWMGMGKWGEVVRNKRKLEKKLEETEENSKNIRVERTFLTSIFDFKVSQSVIPV
jgi:hypothetical protein